MSNLALALTVAIACAVEMVEAATIVLAMEATRGRRAAFTGAITALVALAAITAAVGPAIVSLPINDLRLVVGTLLLIFGLDWLRKAILRSSGHKALHDEVAIFAARTEAASSATRTRERIDRYGFIVSFKGVLLEGLEVVFIVLTFGAAQHALPVAIAGAALAVFAVTAVAAVVRKPLSRVPENAMKFYVGVTLCAFGSFWSAEAVDVRWPGDALSIAVLMVFYFVIARLFVNRLRVA